MYNPYLSEQGLFRKYVDIVGAIEAEYSKLPIEVKKILGKKGFKRSHLKSMQKVASIISKITILGQEIYMETEHTRDVNQLSLL